MQTQAVPHTPGRPADAAQGAAAKNTAARLPVFGAGESDFLSMLMSRDERDEAAAAEPQSRDASRDSGREADSGQRPSKDSATESSEPQAIHLQTSEQRQQASSTAVRPDAPKAEAVKPSAGDGEANREPVQTTRDPQPLKATVEAAAVDSRPRSALATGASQAAIAAQSQASAQTSTQGAGQTTAQGETQAAKTDSAQASQRPDVTQLARGSAQAREQGAGQGNTTLAGLEAMAQGKSAEKAQANQAAGNQATNTANAVAQQSGQTSQGQQAQQTQNIPLVPQVAERVQAQARTASPASGGTGQIAALSSAAVGSDAVSGATGASPLVKTDAPNAAKPMADAGRTANPVVDQVSVRIQKAAAAGQDRIQIKLNPAELGRVDVKLEFQSDGGVRAVVSVERPETFDLLQRDARSLERALQDAGFKSGQTDLSFEMQTGGQGQSYADDGSGSGTHGSERENSAGALASQTAEAQAQADAAPQARAVSDGRVDLRI